MLGVSTICLRGIRSTIGMSNHLHSTSLCFKHKKTTDISVISPPLACNFIIVGLSSGYMQLAMADPAHMMHNCTIHNLTIYAAPWKKKKTPAQLRREPWLPVGGGSIGLTQGMVQGWVSSFTGCPGCSHCIFAALPLRIERGWRSTTG